MIHNLSNTLELTKTFLYIYRIIGHAASVEAELQSFESFLIFQFPNEEEVKQRSKCKRLGQHFIRRTMQIHSGLGWIMRKFWNSVSICLSSLDTKTYASID